MSAIETPPQAGHQPVDGTGTPRIGPWPAVLVGVVAVGLTLGVAELLAALGAWLGVLDAAASPFGSLGAGFIVITPEWLKDIGISLFGQSDKVALAVTMSVTFVVVAAVIGVVGRVNAWAAAALGAVMVVVTGIAILTRPATSPGDLVPLLAGAAAGIGFLLHVLRPWRDPYRQIHAASGASGAGAASSSASGTATSEAQAGGPDRRAVLRVTGLAALGAAVAGGLSRLVPSVADVQADRASVRLPPVSTPGAGGAGRASGAGGADSGSAAASAGSPPGGASAGGAAASTPTSGTGRAPRPAEARMLPLPAGVNPAVPELTPYVTPASSFYRVDTAFTLPRVTTDAWSLTVHGLVDTPVTVDWQQLLAMPQVERWITLTCVSNEVGGNLAGNAAWQGVRIADILARAEPKAGADCVYATSADHFTVTTPLDALTDGRDALLAIGMNGAPLPVEHGFPVRMVVPGLYGYVSATKWVVDLEVTRFADVSAYWTERGWAPRGPIKTASRIDTPHYDVTVGPGVVPVAGVAWAQHRGISAVQVQVDDGPWRKATLAGTASKDTWRQWVFRWDTGQVKPGNHTLRCRAVDGAGAVQSATVAPPAPNGASGYHQVTVVTR